MRMGLTEKENSVRRLAAALVLICLVLMSTGLSKADGISQAQIPAGASNFLFNISGSDVNSPIRVWSYRPQKLNQDSPIVFVMHGVNRDAQRYLNDWTPYAEKYKFLLVCPEFDSARFSTSAYQCGNMFDASKQAIPKRDWTFTTIENLFDFVRTKAENISKKYYIFGHSAGGQFVHRLVLFSPSARYVRAVAANPGWYTMPSYTGHKFPYGLRDSNLSETDLKTSLGRDFVLMLGEQDLDPNDSNLRQTGAAEEQGATRLERGQNYMRAANAEASALGAQFNWRLQSIPGAHHSDAQVASAAAAAMFSK